MPSMVVGPYEKYRTLVDEEDVHFFLEHDWVFDGRYIKRKENGKRRGKGVRDPSKVFYLHREIMKPSKGMEVDHINGDKLDNRRSNLRICTRHQNNMNTSGSCVYRRKDRPYGRKIWMARITHYYQTITVGYYETKEEAMVAVVMKRRELRGGFAYE